MRYNKTINILIISLIILELIFSVYLIYEEKTKVSNICIIGTSCESVRESSYGEIFGIKLFYISIVAFLILLLTYIYNKKIFLIECLIGSIFSLYLIFVQLFVLKQICSSCMIIDLIMIVILILGVINRNGKL